MNTEGDWLLTPARAAIHTPTATAVVSDLHLGYAEARRRGGDAVPAAPLEAVLAPLRALARHGVRRLAIAGDLFESGHDGELADRLIAWLDGEGVELVGVVPGNHDRGLKGEGRRLPVCDGPLLLGGWHVVHGDGPLTDGPVVQGHLHPCVRLGASCVRAACYLSGPRRLILPAFSPEAAGADVLGRDEWGELRCHVIAGDRVLDFGDLDSLRRRTGRRR